MTIGVALLLIAAGAILRFALSTVSTHGVDVHTIGVILMVVGAIGLVIWAFVWAPWVRRGRSAYPPPPPVEEHRPAPGAYRSGERPAYRSGEPPYEDHYPG
jgi:hypothetical protein